MTQNARIVGTVEFRPGEGPLMCIPRGPVAVDTARAEVTLSWVDGETRGTAAMPLAAFRRYVSTGAIALTPA